MVRLLIISYDTEGVKALAHGLHGAFRNRRVFIDAADGAVSALVLLHMQGYDALLVRPVMPARLGWRFIEQLHRIRPQARIVVMGNTVAEHDAGETASLWMISGVVPTGL